MGWALVMAFQILTMDFWENLYERVTKPAMKHSLAYYTLLQFTVHIFLCVFGVLHFSCRTLFPRGFLETTLSLN